MRIHQTFGVKKQWTMESESWVWMNSGREKARFSHKFRDNFDGLGFSRRMILGLQLRIK
jgi:hypothetical protein